jgi:hypothetical protein
LKTVHVRLLTFLALITFFVMGCQTSSRQAKTVTNLSLRSELLAMEAADQKLRGAVFSHGQTNLIAELQTLDRKHTARMKEVLSMHGWPGHTLVGKEGSSAAWLLVQHATHDTEFMRHALALMAEAVRQGEASGRDYAYLMDRVRLQEGKKQIYGTQFLIGADGEMQVQPIEDAAKVDRLRKQVGLPPLAEYERQLRKVYKVDSDSSGKVLGP